MSSSLPPAAEMSAMLSAARVAVRRAAVIATKVRARVLADGDKKVSKADASPVTIADYAAQVAVTSTLMDTLGYDGAAAAGAAQSSSRGPFRLMGEEDDTTLKGAGGTLLDSVVAALNESWPREEAARGPWTGDEVLSYLSRGGYAGEGEGASSSSSSSPPSSPSPSSPSGPGYWILDPIDGTKGYVRGGQYAVGLAFVFGGRPVLGVMACPSLPFPTWGDGSSAATIEAAVANGGTLFAAQEGAGATMEPLALPATAALVSSEGGGPAAPSPIRVASSVTDGPSLVLAESFDAGHSDHSLSTAVAGALGLTAAPIRIDSMCKYGLLSRGDAHVYLRFPRPGYSENVWDHAPGVVLLQEAGGIVTDAAGKPLDFRRGRALAGNYGVVASNCREVHDKLVAAIAGK